MQRGRTPSIRGGAALAAMGLAVAVLSGCSSADAEPVATAPQPTASSGSTGPTPTPSASESVDVSAALRIPVSITLPGHASMPVETAVPGENDELVLPKTISTGFWWPFSAVPGDAEGTSLIVGHKDQARIGNGPFASLPSYEPGDRITIGTESGPLTFEVTGGEEYHKQALPDSLFARTGKARLALVTCGGPYANGSYRDNYVIYAKQV